MSLAGPKMLAKRIANLHRETACLLLLCMFGAIIRLGALAAVGPVEHLDSDGYIVFADLMLNDSQWRHNPDLTSFPTRSPTFRPDITDKSGITIVRLIGYPALLAAAKLISPDAYKYLVCVIQIALAALAHGLMFVASRRMLIPRIVAVPSILLFSLSFPLLYDISILSDSIFNNLMIIVMSIIIIKVIMDRTYNLFIFMTISTLLLLNVFFRDVGIYFSFLFSGFILTLEYFRRRQAIRSILIGILVCAPSIVALEFYKSWNAYRTGERFTAVVSYTMLRPVIALELSGSRVLPDNTGLRRALEDIIGTETESGRCERKKLPGFFDFSANRRLHGLAHTCMNVMQEHLLKKYNLNNAQITRIAKSTLIKTAASHPLQMVRFMFSEMLPQMAMGIVTFDQVIAIATGADFSRQISVRSLLSSIKIQSFDLYLSTMLSFELLSRFISTILFAAFYLVLPIMMAVSIRMRMLPESTKLSLSLHYLISVALLIGYSLIHIEPRYFMAAQALILIDGSFALSLAVREIRNWRMRSKAN